MRLWCGVGARKEITCVCVCVCLFLLCCLITIITVIMSLFRLCRADVPTETRRQVCLLHLASLGEGGGRKEISSPLVWLIIRIEFWVGCAQVAACCCMSSVAAAARGELEKRLREERESISRACFLAAPARCCQRLMCLNHATRVRE